MKKFRHSCLKVWGASMLFMALIFMLFPIWGGFLLNDDGSMGGVLFALVLLFGAWWLVAAIACLGLLFLFFSKESGWVWQVIAIASLLGAMVTGYIPTKLVAGHAGYEDSRTVFIAIWTVLTVSHLGSVAPFLFAHFSGWSPSRKFRTEGKGYHLPV